MTYSARLVAFATVQYGPYFSFSLAEMQGELSRYKAALQASTPGAGNIVSASVNGSSFTYGPNGTWSLAEWQANIQDALSQVDDDVQALPGEARVRFR